MKMEINKRIRLYILISLGWTYVFWVMAAAISSKNPVWTGIQVLHFLGGIGPLLAALYTVTKMRNWKDYLRRCIKFSGFTPLIWLSIIGPVFVGVISSLIARGRIQLSGDFVASGLLYALFLFFFGPLPEELGWRGVLFDLSSRQSLIKAQAVTASVWLLWHLPLFFIAGSYQQDVGFATTRFVFWSISLVLQSLIMGYLYLLSNRSIVSVILFHYTVNLAGEAFKKNTTTEVITIVAFAGLALFLAFVYHQRSD